MCHWDSLFHVPNGPDRCCTSRSVKQSYTGPRKIKCELPFCCVPLTRIMYSGFASKSLQTMCLLFFTKQYVFLAHFMAQWPISLKMCMKIYTITVCEISKHFLVAQWTTNWKRLGGPVNIDWSVDVMCCANLTIFAFVDVIYPSMATVLGLPTDHPDKSIDRPVDLDTRKVSWPIKAEAKWSPFLRNVC